MCDSSPSDGLIGTVVPYFEFHRSLAAPRVFPRQGSRARAPARAATPWSLPPRGRGFLEIYMSDMTKGE